jgi:hypothetical protein
MQIHVAQDHNPQLAALKEFQFVTAANSHCMWAICYVDYVNTNEPTASCQRLVSDNSTVLTVCQ